MEIRRWHYYVIFNCVIIKYLEGKTISLNEVITAESQQKESFRTSLLPKSADHTHLGGSILSPLKYKKTYLIKSPLKPRKLKLISKSRYKRKNQSTKREINGNEELKQKYIPLLKSLSILFDNILNSDSSESYEVKRKKYKRNRFYSEETFEVPGGTQGFDSGITESESQEEAVTFSSSPTTATSIIIQTPATTEATPTTTNIITTRDFSAIRQNKNIPVLFPRNTFSGRGNDTGISERSGTTRHGNVEGNITRHHGDHEHATGCREDESCTENDEENTHGVTRDGARGFRFPGATGDRHIGLFLGGNRTDSKNTSETETADVHNRENQFKTGRDETKSGRVLQEPIRRLRGFISKDVNENTESVQPKEIREESVVNVTHDNAGYQRITSGGSSTAKENQKVRTGNETMMVINSLNFTTTQSNTPKKKSPVMMIFDGYSTVKHKNGQNKFAEKSIHIHS